MKKYTQHFDGDHFPIPWTNWVSRCCDCGLVHQFTFRKRSGRLWVKVEQNRRKTAASRRTKKYVRT